MNLKRYYVYILFDWQAVPFYVGKGTGNRWLHHETKYDSDNWLKNEIVERTFNILGEIPKIKVRDELIENDAINAEVALIAAIGRMDQGKGPLVNMTDGGDGISGYKHRQDTIIKMRKTALKTSAKRSIDMRQWSTGKTLSKITKEKLRQANLGKTYSIEINLKKGRPGRPLSLEHRQAISKAKTGKPTGIRTRSMLGKKHSEATIQKMKEIRKGRPCTNLFVFSRKGRKHSIETKAKISASQKVRLAKRRVQPIEQKPDASPSDSS